MPRYNLDEREQTSLIRACLRNKDLYSTSRHNFWIRVTDDLHDLCNSLTYTARTCAKYVNKMMNERDDALADALANNTDDANSDRGEDWILAMDQWIGFVVSPEAALKPKRTVRNTAATAVIQCTNATPRLSPASAAFFTALFVFGSGRHTSDSGAQSSEREQPCAGR